MIVNERCRARAIQKHLVHSRAATFVIAALTLSDDLDDFLLLIFHPLVARVQSMPNHGACTTVIHSHSLRVTHKDTGACMEVALLMKVWSQTLDETLLHGNFLCSLRVIVSTIASLLDDRTQIFVILILRRMIGCHTRRLFFILMRHDEAATTFKGTILSLK